MSHPNERTWRSPEGVDFIATLVRVDALGHAWYQFADALTMPASRAVQAEIASEWAELNMTKPDAKAFLQEMRQSGNAGDIVTMFSILDRMEERLDWAMDGKSLMELAKVYFLIDDEPFEAATQKHLALKDEVFANDEATRGFFLHSAYVLTRGYSELSPTDILRYSALRQMQRLKAVSVPEKSAAQASEGGTSRRRFMDAAKNSTRKRS